jgi:hypothetical protein
MTFPMASAGRDVLQAAILVGGFGGEEAAGRKKAVAVVKSTPNSKNGKTETPRARLLVIVFIAMACVEL